MKNKHQEVIGFALGCFWGKQYLFQNTLGVISTRVGYTGGHTTSPNYLEVCSKKSGHAEAVEITFNPGEISFEELLKIFFQNHDPTNRNRQGENNSGNYRSAIFFHNKNQETISLATIKSLKEKGYDIVTQVSPAMPFYIAEDRHQGYCERTGNIPKVKSYPVIF